VSGAVVHGSIETEVLFIHHQLESDTMNVQQFNFRNLPDHS